MTRAHNFVVDLAKAGKGYKEIQEMVDIVYGVKSLKKSAIYVILKKVKAGENTDDQRHLNPKKRTRTPALIGDVAAAVEENRRICINELASAYGVSEKTIHTILHKDLGLVKKSARWVPKLLSEEQKKDRMQTCTKFLAIVNRQSKAMLDNIVTMDELAVSFHTPETKQQSKQWIKKGMPGPLKAKVHATRTKQMVLAFFDSKGLIYTNYVPRGTTINAIYIVKALGQFMKILRKKRPVMVKQKWFFHWDTAPVHTAAVVRDWMAAKQILLLPHPPYLLDLAPADFFLFPKIKTQLAGLTLTQETFKKTWDGVTRTIAAPEYTTAFRQWYERCEKCIQIGGDYVEKS